MSEPPRLVSLHMSPWSERARWALDHHRIPYRLIQHMPFLGERRLRRLRGARPGRATVPVLLAGDEVLPSSWDIACHADRVGHGERLIPAELTAEIQRYHDLAERAMIAGRPITIRRMLASDAALDESLPPAVPRWLRPLLRPTVRFGTRWFARKYALDLRDVGMPTEMREALSELRATLAGGDYLLGRFTYADIIMASLLQGIAAVADRYIRLGPATRAVWTQPEAARDYADLIAWRDRLYERHRPPRTKP